ncbi:MAG: helix-turn-helix domain-containing protein [archaeon]|nr:helix-turn-helix domain-containing protein [archaeon]
MLRQVSLSIENPVNPFRDLALKRNCKITIVDCKDFNSHGIALVLEIDGSSHADEESLLKELREMSGVRHAYWGGNPGNGGILAMVIMDTPVYCGIARDSGIVCSSCPFNSADSSSECSWKLLVSDANALRRSLDMLKNLGIRAETQEVSSARYEEMLTFRQKEVFAAAVKSGYFEFPRGISLNGLARKLSIKPSTLSEILRRAEGKMAKYYAGNPSSMILPEVRTQEENYLINKIH